MSHPLSELKGIVPPVVTPDLPDGTLDIESFERQIERLISAGCHGLFFLGSTGQVVFMTDEQRDLQVREAVRIVNGRVPVLVGAIDTQTDRVIEQARRAAELGADAAVITAPFYALCGPEQVETHFRQVHEALPELPIFAYDIPVCVHVKLGWKMVMQLAADGVIAGYKDSSADDISFRYLCEANAEAGHPLCALTGHEMVVDGALLSGADGAVPGLANIDPEGYVRMWNASQAGDWETVRAEQTRLNKLSHIFDVTTGIQGYGAGVGSFKTALMLMGVFPTNHMPRPVRALEGENVEAIRAVLEDCGIL